MGYGNLAENLACSNADMFGLDNILTIERFNGSIRKKSTDNTNKKSRRSTEVYPFKTLDEIKLMVDKLDEHISNAHTTYNKKRWCRNKLIFIVGINLGIRGSDLCSLRWSDFFYDDYTFRDGIAIQPIKTRNTTGKYVFLYFNKDVKSAILEYIEGYPIDSLDDYVFFSKTSTSNSGEHVSREALGKMLKSIAKECGLRQNVNSHSLRKTFGYRAWHMSDDKSETLTKLQRIFGHASLRDTQKYIGIEREELAEVFYGFDSDSLY
jgi:integrase